MNNIITISSLSNKLSIIDPSEFLSNEKNLDDSIYLGTTSIYRIPLLYNQRELINPHISILGTSGSGKTNMMLNLIMKFSLSGRINIIILDWSGEYSEIAEYLGLENKLNKKYSKALSDTYINLSEIKSEAKVSEACKALNWIIGNFAFNAKNNSMVFIDEIWHLLNVPEAQKLVSVIFREGRKYGVGIVAATQLLSDVNNEIIYNSGTVLIFKLYGSENMESLKSSMLLDADDLINTPTLEIGSCYCITMQKDGIKTKSILKRCQKFYIKFCLVRCKYMDYKISKSEIIRHASSILGQEIGFKLESLISSNETYIALEKITLELIKNGCSREKIIYFLRRLGISDIEIAKSMGSLISKM